MAQGQPKSYRRGQYARNTGATPEQCRASSLYGSMDQAQGWFMRKWNTALGQGIFTFDGTPGANFFRLRGCRSHIVCHKSKNKPFWMGWRSRRLARRLTPFPSLAPGASLSPGDQAGGGAALLCGAVARPMAGVAGLLGGGPASASWRPVDWVDRSSASQAFEFGAQ